MTPSLHILQSIFGYPAFRLAQSEVVEHVCAGGDALVLMPTGGGKSLCYQIPAIVRQQADRGISIVVSPLIALMHDQVGALQELGVATDFLNSSQDYARAAQVERQMMAGELTLVYVAPERMVTPRFLDLLDSLYARQKIALFAIDEAHCVSQWGHDFRPEYRELALLHTRFPEVPRIALTATADALTRQDICERLQLEEARLFLSSFDRPNIFYTITAKDNAVRQLLCFIEENHSGQAGIVYCQSRKRCEDIAAQLEESGLSALPYHAGLAADVRARHQNRFLREEGLIMVATVAFGMGIDKPDVRFVAHVDMPKNLEAYYQETGRAGRDGLPAQAWMCFGLGDVVNQRRMIDESPAPEDFKRVLRGKLEALLQLAESHHCRRQALLAYFGEASQPCGHCDNCANPPELWDASDAAQKLLSTVYRVEQKSHMQFGAAHTMDIVRGKHSDKVSQYGHESISTFGLGKDYSEALLRTVMRQLVALGALRVNTDGFQTLSLSPRARPILRGEERVELRKQELGGRAKCTGSRTKSGRPSMQDKTSGTNKVVQTLSSEAQQKFDALRAWRHEVASSHNLPAYVIFHDQTLRDIASLDAIDLESLSQVSGVGARKLEAYGEEVLSVLSRQK